MPRDEVKRSTTKINTDMHEHHGERGGGGLLQDYANNEGLVVFHTEAEYDI